MRSSFFEQRQRAELWRAVRLSRLYEGALRDRKPARREVTVVARTRRHPTHRLLPRTALKRGDVGDRAPEVQPHPSNARHTPESPSISGQRRSRNRLRRVDALRLEKDPTDLSLALRFARSRLEAEKAVRPQAEMRLCEMHVVYDSLMRDMTNRRCTISARSTVSTASCSSTSLPPATVNPQHLCEVRGG